MTINRNLSILAGGVSSTGVLGVPNGGSGATTLTGYLIGNGTSAFTASATIPTSSLSGTLNIANGGTGQTTASTAFNALSPLTTAGDTLYGGVSGAGTRLGIGTAGQVLTVNSGATAPQWTTLSGVAVTTFQTSLSGLTPSTATSGAVTLAGTLGVASGGTGATTLTGYVYGNGIGAMTASTTIPTSALSGTVSLTTQVSGILPIANGGTAQSSFTANQIHYGSFSTSSNFIYNTDVTLTGGNYLCSAGKGLAYLADATRIVTPEDNVSGGLFQVGSGSIIRFKSGTSLEIMRMFGTGGVSIGNTTDPGATNLSVNGNLYVGSTSNIVNSRFVTKFDQAGNSGLGIQNTSATATGYMVAFYNSSATLQGSITQVSSTIIAYSTTSDYRLKNNVMPIDNALDTVKALKPISFTWDDGRKDDGFLAHELQAVIPNCVIGEKDAVNENGTPKYQQMDNSGVIPFLVKAIQEQQLIIEQLKAKVGI